MSVITELRNDIVALLVMMSCTFEELISWDFLKNISEYGMIYFIRDLEKISALYYKGNVMYIKKKRC